MMSSVGRDGAAPMSPADSTQHKIGLRQSELGRWTAYAAASHSQRHSASPTPMLQSDLSANGSASGPHSLKQQAQHNEGRARWEWPAQHATSAVAFIEAWSAGHPSRGSASLSFPLPDATQSHENKSLSLPSPGPTPTWCRMIAAPVQVEPTHVWFLVARRGGVTKREGHWRCHARSCTVNAPLCASGTDIW